MMQESAERIVRNLQDLRQIRSFAGRVMGWLATDSAQEEETGHIFTNSRARAILKASEVVDDATLHDFESMIDRDAFARVTMYDLLVQSNLAENDEIAAIARMPTPEEIKDISWLALIVAVFAWRSEYLLYQFDPTTPPSTFSPAGQVLTRSAHFIRQQIQRSATERDKLAMRLAQPPLDAPRLDELEPESGSIAPLPPHFRPPVPERYSEIAREMLEVGRDDIERAPSGITIGEPLVISEDELSEVNNQASEPVRLPPITISSNQLPAETTTPPSPLPSSGVVLPSSSQSQHARPSFTVALRQMFGQEELTTTKLRVLIQEYPDGPGLYGLQVRVTCKGIKSYVAGTTDREGKFVCELPVRVQSGLTYDIDVTWPREKGGEIERKSITLNADRTQFTLPFYCQLNPPSGTG